MKVYREETKEYDSGQLGKPWIAEVKFHSAKKSDFQFGKFIGKAGQAGTLELDCPNNSIVAKGQKNLMGIKSKVEYFAYRYGTLKLLGDRGAAYGFFVGQKEGTTQHLKEVEEEREELLARLSVLDETIAKIKQEKIKQAESKFSDVDF